MSWNTIADTDVLVEFTPAEKSAFNAIQGATTNLAAILTNVVAAVRGNIRAGGYDVSDTAATIPDQLRSDVIAVARWRWLISFPQLKALQTDARKAAAESAEKKFDQIANQKFNVEPPTTDTVSAGNWNSERKIIGRAFPVPKPSSQFQGESGYANPDGPTNN